MYYEPKQPSLMNLFGTVGVFLVFALYGFISLNTEDALWFVPTFSESPQQMTVYCYGNAVALDPKSETFETVTELVNEAISGRKNWDSLSMSDETYNYYQTSDAVMVLKVEYAQPVRIHSIYKYFSNVDTLMIPLDGRHSQTNAVFGRAGENTTAGSLHVGSFENVVNLLDAAGLCTSG